VSVPGPSAIVVGAGVVGAACAEALSGDGWRVTVLEAEFPGAGATGAAMGHVVVMDDSEPQLALTAYSRRLWAERAPQLPPECEDDPCGTIWVAASEEEMEAARAKAAAHARHGQPTRLLDAAALREVEPALCDGLAGGLLVPADRVVYPVAAARFLLGEALARGAVLRAGARVEAVAAGRALCGERWVEADAVVVAAGARTVDLVPELPIVPRKGQLVVTERGGLRVRHQLVELGYLASARALGSASVAFNVQPRPTGQLLVGSSRELAGWNSEVDRALCARMLRRACAYLPGLAASRAIRAWAGFRPATPDHLPFVGRWQERLWVAAGHEGLGITTAPATGRLLADLMAGRASAIDAAPFDPRRPQVAHA
jgi:glycine/D-amino acid oxidase-like deaminating enzyme